MSKLPKVYGVSKSKKQVNNEEVFYSNSEEKDFMLEKDDKTNNLVSSLMIRKRINDIFSSPSFVYKVNVRVNIKGEGWREVTLIHRNNDSVLTIDNEVIMIKDILEVTEK